MQIWEHGQEHARTLLFFPCTAEPVWAFSETIALLSRKWHVFQVIYDGHQPEYPGDFTSVEQTVDEVTAYLKSHGVVQLDAAYGCSLGGACLTRLLALGEIPVGRAIIDGGITPYQFPYPLRKLRLALDVLSFKLAANNRKVLEAAFPPERFTLPGHDAVKEYDEIERYEHGGAWHEALKEYLDGNFAFVKKFLARELPEAVMYIPETTYLAWVDLGKCLPETTDLPDFFANKAGVLLEGGNGLFVGNAAGYIRLNLAMPRSIIETGLTRMVEAIRKEQG